MPNPHAYDGKSNRALLLEANRKLDILMGAEALELRMELHMDQVLADLTNAVEQTKQTQASAIVLINGIADRIDTLNKDRDAALVNLTQQLRDNAAALAVAVDAQAPAQPPVEATA
jgi:hypothetical protein